MDRDLAILVLNACYRASRELGEAGVMVGELAPGEPGRTVKMDVGMAIAEIGKVTGSIFREHPDLEAYVEGRLDKFGRLS